MKKNINTDDKKFVRDGEVAVLVSPGFGAGWSTWNPEYPHIIYDHFIADLLVHEVPDWMAKALAYCELKYPDAYLGGLEDLQVQWIPVGTLFRVNEYDGSETIEIRDQMTWHTA